MKLMFLGDVMGRAGRAGVAERLPKLRADWALDFVVVNGENASQGAGLTAEHAHILLQAGADVITLGDHAFDQKDMMQFAETEPRIIRPLNFSKVAPGRGARVFDADGGFVESFPAEMFEGTIADDDLAAVDASAPIGRFWPARSLDTIFLPGSTSEPEERRVMPVLEVIVPLQAGPDSRLVGIAQFIIEGHSIAAEFNRLDRHLMRQACMANTSYQLHYASAWSSVRNTPDYFNSCSSQGSGFSTPNTVIGFQYAASGGAYAGFYSYFPSSGQPRECLGTVLASPLIIGTKYFVNFKVNLRHIDSISLNNCATDHIGALFSTNQYGFSTPVPINNFAQVYSNSIVSDTANWTTIKGSFVADSAYQYLSIGNFFDDLSTNKTYLFFIFYLFCILFCR